MVDADDVRDALGTVEDPELPLSIVDMGLVYGVELEARDDGTHVVVEMTFTAMGCPAMDILKHDVREAVRGLEGVQDVEIETVWDPPWTTDRLSEEAKNVLETTGVTV